MPTMVDGSIVALARSMQRFAGKRVHFIGIGGSGMSGAAAMLIKAGARVSGSDQQSFDGLGELVQAGARISIGHLGAQLDTECDLVVRSAAIHETNPEMEAARSFGLTPIKYAELLGRIMACYPRGISIAGTHGKSTTTAMCTYLCRYSGLEPSFLFGARSDQLGGSWALGSGEHFIAESCEFDRSFLHVAPESAAILNIEPDHLDCYRDLDEIVEAFGAFCSQVHPEGLVICNADDSRALEAAGRSRATIQSFGFGENADWRALNLREDRGCFSFVVQFRGSPVVSTRLSVPGRHNVADALAAIALAYHAGADLEGIADALPGFEGIDRRLTWRGAGRGVVIVDDYAHHPTEVKVSIEAARRRYNPGRTWVVFQPHQHARTRLLLEEFAEAFGDADEIVLPDVFGAREGGAANEPVGSAELAERIRQCGSSATYLPELAVAADHVVANVRDGDLVLTMGAGDVWKVADELVARLCGSD